MRKMVHSLHGNVEITFRYNTDSLNRKVTTCTISLLDTGLSFIGASVCAAGDQFVKSTGRRIALSRALVEFSKADRKEFWDFYHSRNANHFMIAVDNEYVLGG